MLFTIAARIAYAFGFDAVLTGCRLWLSDAGPWLDAMRHADGSLTLAMGRREVTVSRLFLG